MFEELYIPRDTFKNKGITNASYKLAHNLSEMSTIDALEKYNIKKTELLTDFHLPLHMVMDYIETPQEALDLAEISDSKTFFEHVRWYRNIAGDEMYEKLAREKLEALDDPLVFLSKKDHLINTGAVTEELMEYMETRISEVLDELMKDVDLDRIALIVDISSSMYIAVDITNKLYEVFSRAVNIDPVIAFNDRARKVGKEELMHLKPNGMTKISSAFDLLENELANESKKGIPDAIILISDLEETIDPTEGTSIPRLDASLKLIQEKFGTIPLVVLLCGNQINMDIDYPHGKIKVDNFHPRLIKSIMQQITRATSKVAIKEKRKTEILKERTPIEEEIAQIGLPKRPKESLQKGYLEGLLVPSDK